MSWTWGWDQGGESQQVSEAGRDGRVSGQREQQGQAEYSRSKLFLTVKYVLVYRKFYGGVGGAGRRRYVRYVLVFTIYATVRTVDLSLPCG